MKGGSTTRAVALHSMGFSSKWSEKRDGER
jgi:hypothetical protein